MNPNTEVLAAADDPNLDDLVLEDGEPVESIFAEKQQRLLVEPLYSSWPGPGPGRPFLALANVGLFHTPGQPPLAPDVMLSLDVQVAANLSRKENRSYLAWVLGKQPEVVIEIVSDRRGGEAAFKLHEYAQVGVAHYVILDPDNRLDAGLVRAFRLQGGAYVSAAWDWWPDMGLGLTLWEGSFEGYSARWLRWCDRQGQVIPTGQERAEQERQRAEQERQRAEQERQHAEQERQHAEQERQHAEQERQLAEQLAARLRALGIDPSA